MIHGCVSEGGGQTLKLDFANKALLHCDRQGARNPNYLQILWVSVCMLSLCRTLFKAVLFTVVLHVLGRKLALQK